MKQFARARWLAGFLTAALLLPGLPAGAAGYGGELASAGAALAREVEAEAIVLLENNGMLPLTEGVKVALFGAGQHGRFYNGGGGSAGTNGSPGMTALRAFQAAEKEGRLSLYQPLAEYYQNVTADGLLPDEELLTGARAFTDTAVVFISRFSEEGTDRKIDRGDYYLSLGEEDLLAEVRSLFDKVVVVLNLCGVTDLSWLKGPDALCPADAALAMWMPGQYGSPALIDVLLGEVNPSGRLSDTFAADYADYPSRSFGQREVEYTEDVYVGYRYFETFADARERVLYPFGYGLSYTDFSIDAGEVVASAARDLVSVTARVKNVGARAGKQVVQVYAGHPEPNRLGYPAKELVAYQKTDLLAPGESQTLTLTFARSALAGYDDLGKIQKSAYVLEAGEYPVYVGDSVRAATEVGRVKVERDEITAQLTERCTAVMELPRRLVNVGGEKTYEDLPQRPPEADETAGVVTALSVDATCLLQAEDYALAEGSDILSVSGGAVHNTHALGTLTYRVACAGGGAFAVYAYLAQGANTGRDCLAVSVNGVRQTDFVLDVTEPTGGWETYRLFPCGTLTLPDGDSVITVQIQNGAVGNLDHFRFCPLEIADGERYDLTGARNPIRAEGQSVLEAERYTSTTNPSLSRNPAGYLEALHIPGTITYDITVEQAADYALQVVTAVGNDGSADALRITVDGELQAGVLLNTQGGTGGWSTMQTFSAGYLSLPAGEHQLVLTPNGCGNLDKFVLTRLPGGRTAAFDGGAPTPDDELIPFAAVARGEASPEDFVAQMNLTELMTTVQGRGAGTGSAWCGSERFGIPNGTLSDGGSGLRGGTWLPIATAQACTWNDDLLLDVGLQVGAEAWALGVDLWLGPAMNIHRNPLCARNFEYFSEDPLLAGRCAGALIRGVQAQGVGATVKHFCANNTDTDRNRSDSRLSERALRQIYLAGFAYAVKTAAPVAVMSSYNRVNGCETSESADLITGILRGEWGFEGLVMTDWWNDSNEAKELLAGNDLKMPDGSNAEMITALQSGMLTRETLERSAVRVLHTVLWLDRTKAAYQNGFVHQTAVVRPEPGRLGDVDGDGTINASDALLALQRSVRMTPLTADETARADVDGSDAVNAADALLMLQHSVRLIDRFPAERDPA